MNHIRSNTQHLASRLRIWLVRRSNAGHRLVCVCYWLNWYYIEWNRLWLDLLDSTQLVDDRLHYRHLVIAVVTAAATALDVQYSSAKSSAFLVVGRSFGRSIVDVLAFLHLKLLFSFIISTNIFHFVRSFSWKMSYFFAGRLVVVELVSFQSWSAQSLIKCNLMAIFKRKYSQRTVSNFSLHFDALAQFWLNYRLCDNIFCWFSILRNRLPVCGSFLL